MTATDKALRKTPLYQQHIDLKAKIVPFGGWEMPVQYDEGILAEYEETRNRVSVFDISHMGEFIIEGDPVEIGLDKIVTQSLVDLPEKSCRYGAMLNDKGGVIDDLIVFRISKNKWMLVVNGSTIQKDAAQIKKYLSSSGTFSDCSSELGKLDIQGPDSRDVLLSLVKGIDRLKYYQFDEFDVLGEKVVVSRTGYTGELGYEIYFPWERTQKLWEEILKLGVKPAGLGVRDLLRIEMGYCLYGYELADDISPLESGLNRFIDWNKNFVGKDSLLKER